MCVYIYVLINANHELETKRNNQIKEGFSIYFLFAVYHIYTYKNVVYLYINEHTRVFLLSMHPLLPLTPKAVQFHVYRQVKLT